MICFPILVLEFKILIVKFPSALTKPANQKGCFISVFKIKGLDIGVKLGKAAINLSFKPQLIEDLILIIFSRPCGVKCFFSLITLKDSLNNI